MKAVFFSYVTAYFLKMRTVHMYESAALFTFHMKMLSALFRLPGILETRGCCPVNSIFPYQTLFKQFIEVSVYSCHSDMSIILFHIFGYIPNSNMAVLMLHQVIKYCLSLSGFIITSAHLIHLPLFQFENRFHFTTLSPICQAACRRCHCFSNAASGTQIWLLTYIIIKVSGNFSMSASADDAALRFDAGSSFGIVK